MSDRRNDPFFQKLAAYAMPVTLVIAGWLAQNSYSQISRQLERIEQNQTASTEQYHTLRLRIAALESITTPAGVGLRPPPARDARTTRF